MKDKIITIIYIIGIIYSLFLMLYSFTNGNTDLLILSSAFFIYIEIALFYNELREHIDVKIMQYMENEDKYINN